MFSVQTWMFEIKDRKGLMISEGVSIEIIAEVLKKGLVSILKNPSFRNKTCRFLKDPSFRKLRTWARGEGVRIVLRD